MHHQRPSKPCRCLFHITPVIPNRHLTPSSLLFFIHNSQLALNGGCFQAELPPNSHRTPRLGSNNGSGDIRDGMVNASFLSIAYPLLTKALLNLYLIYFHIFYSRYSLKVSFTSNPKSISFFPTNCIILN